MMLDCNFQMMTSDANADTGNDVLPPRNRALTAAKHDHNDSFSSAKGDLVSIVKPYTLTCYQCLAYKFVLRKSPVTGARD